MLIKDLQIERRVFEWPDAEDGTKREPVEVFGIRGDVIIKRNGSLYSVHVAQDWEISEKDNTESLLHFIQKVLAECERIDKNWKLLEEPIDTLRGPRDLNPPFTF